LLRCSSGLSRRSPYSHRRAADSAWQPWLALGGELLNHAASIGAMYSRSGNPVHPGNARHAASAFYAAGELNAQMFFSVR
jgi:hypothetical protein